MRVLSLLFFLLLVFIAVLYTTIGVQFSAARKRHIHLTLFFIIGLFIGIIGGFVVIYNLQVTKHEVFFDIELSRWLFVTLLAIISGGLLSLFIILRFRKK